MKTKLTLYLDKSVIEALKLHARNVGLSLSQFIEREYANLVHSPPVQEPSPPYFSKMKFEDKLPKDYEWKKDREKYLRKRHG